jgi:hypothetical protein
MKTTIKATPKLAELAREAISIQDACNLCGLAQRFAEVMIELGDCNGTGPRNQHPIARMWIDKFCSLARMKQDFESFGDTYRATKKLAAEQDAEMEVCSS